MDTFGIPLLAILDPVRTGKPYKLGAVEPFIFRHSRQQSALSH